MQPETPLSEQQIFQGKLVTLSLRQVQLAGGQTAQREIVSTRGDCPPDRE